MRKAIISGKKFLKRLQNLNKMKTQNNRCSVIELSDTDSISPGAIHIANYLYNQIFK